MSISAILIFEILKDLFWIYFYACLRNVDSISAILNLGSLLLKTLFKIVEIQFF